MMQKGRAEAQASESLELSCTGYSLV